MKQRLLPLFFFCACSVLLLAHGAGWAGYALAAQEAEAPESGQSDSEQLEGGLFAGLSPEAGPLLVKLGEQGQLKVPEGYFFFNGKEARILLERMQNISNGQELGMLMPASLAWMSLFLFDDVGYVSDDGEEARIDADALLEAYRKGIAEANKERQARGWPTSEALGWSVKPHYNKETHNLEWAMRIKSEAHENDNYNMRMLGREGVMRVILVASDEGFERAIADMRSVLRGYSFIEGRTYAEYVQGDKLAGYGLAALIAGGTVAAAAKTGLLTKFFKPLLVVLAAVGAFVLNLFRRRKP